MQVLFGCVCVCDVMCVCVGLLHHLQIPKVIIQLVLELLPKLVRCMDEIRTPLSAIELRFCLRQLFVKDKHE